MSHIPVALQLASVADECKQDLPGTLAALAKMGYAGVEFAGCYEYSAPEWRKALEAAGLKAVGAHIGLDDMSGDKFAETVEFHRTVGNRFLVAAWLEEHERNSRAALLESARRLNELAERLKPLGMTAGHHNPSGEFRPVEGVCPWEVIASNTNSEVVLQIDTGNAAYDGVEAVPWLEKYPGRSCSVHLKAYSSTNDPAIIGEDEVRWKEVFRVCEAVGGTQLYVVEQRHYSSPYPPLESVERCLRNIREMGG